MWYKRFNCWPVHCLSCPIALLSRCDIKGLVSGRFIYFSCPTAQFSWMDIEGLVYQKDRRLRVPMPANDIVWELCHLLIQRHSSHLWNINIFLWTTFQNVIIYENSIASTCCVYLEISTERTRGICDHKCQSQDMTSYPVTMEIIILKT